MHKLISQPVIKISTFRCFTSSKKPFQIKRSGCGRNCIFDRLLYKVSGYSLLNPNHKNKWRRGWRGATETPKPQDYLKCNEEQSDAVVALLLVVVH